MIKRLIMAFALFTLFFCATLQPVYAWSPFGTVCNQAGAGSSATCKGDSTTNNISGPNGVILKATNIVAYVGGIAAVIMLIYGGIKYVSSAGDAGNAGSAKNTIVYAIVGLIVIALAKTIIGYVISKT